MVYPTMGARHLPYFSGIVSIPKKEDLEKDPLRFVSKLLKLVGLKQHRVGRASKGQYQIDTDSLPFIKQIVAKRSMASLIDGDSAYGGYADYGNYAD